MSDEYEFITSADNTLNNLFTCPYGSRRLLGVNDEANDGTRLTIDAGYVDPQKQIQQMILAGERLNSLRMFDEEEALSNEEFAQAVAQIRHPNTDITEIITYTDMINDRMQNTKSEAERKAVKQALDVGATYKEYEQQNPPEPEPETT